jgi:DsbC/DsbD-like thiol-disulfide interchange protein
MRSFTKIAMFTASSLLLGSQVSLAAQTGWLKTEGGNIRIITEPYMQGASEIRGVIDIDLLDGWKTYWRDPGAGGIPPSFDFSNTTLVNAADIHFPAPTWVKSGYDDFAGYKEPIQIPFTLALSSPAKETTVNARLMVGICAEICIPAFDNFSIKLEEATGSTRDSAIVMNAFSALPKTAADLGVAVNLEHLSDVGTYNLQLNGNLDQLQLFVSSKNGIQFKKPLLLSETNDQKTYRIEPLHALDQDVSVDLIITGTMPQGSFEISGQ